LSDAPAAIVSANAFDKSLDNDVGIRPEDFIVKPVRVSELLDWLGRKLDLQWIEVERWKAQPVAGMATGPGSTGASNDPQGAALALPSVAALKLLEDQVHAGYVRGVHKALDQIDQAEPTCAAFVQEFRALARQFQLDAMANRLREALSQAQAQSELNGAPGPAA